MEQFYTAKNPIWPPLTLNVVQSLTTKVWRVVYQFLHFQGQGMQWRHRNNPRINSLSDSDYLPRLAALNNKCTDRVQQYCYKSL